ncbi:hypothetical protein SBV1_280010 [Verrucomicrobia bacterium]|nr:hypothetical protein SBV1_280010 [Verrucomicrobiota bacterium]
MQLLRGSFRSNFNGTNPPGTTSRATAQANRCVFKAGLCPDYLTITQAAHAYGKRKVFIFQR